MAVKMVKRVGAIVLTLCYGLAVDCSDDGAAIDAGPGQHDACTLAIVTAVAGTVQDQDGNAVTPDRVDVLAEGVVTGCTVAAEADAVRYSCPETQPEQTIEALPKQIYRLLVAVGADEWQFDVEVERENNCHVRTEEFDLVLSPLNGDAGL